MEPSDRTKRADRGIALPLVLAVLVCLLAIAVPFALSMRHEQGGAAWRGADADVRREAASVRDLALSKFAAASEKDSTRWSDPPDRMKVDVEAAARSLGIGDLGPRARLLSGSLDDQAGRIDVNRAPLFLMARLLGLESRLARKLSADDKEIHLLDGDFLQDEGFLWIDGEVTYYKHRENGTVTEFTRPAIVPGVWEPSKLPTDPREFEAGTEVVDMRAWMAAAWIWKSPEIVQPGAEARFESPTHPFAIATFGRGALGPLQRERLERFGTIFTADADRKRFGNPQRVLSALVGGTSAELRIEQGQFAGPGSLCRVTTYERKVDYAFVRKVEVQDDGAKLTLEMPLDVTADPGQAVAEFLLPRPVNVNSCSQEMLELLMTGLKLRGKQTEVDDKAAALVAERMVGARPFNGLKEFLALLDVLVDKEKVLKDEQRLAILLNAENSASSQIEGGTAPFCWASDGVVEVRAAASRNYPLTGREKARAFVRDIVDVGGTGRATRIFATQRDFEAPWWNSRMARGWTTFPENLDVWDGPYGEGAALPPGRLTAMLPPHSLSPAEDLISTGARLAASRMYGYGVGTGTQDDKTWHADGRKGDWDSKDPDGWRMSDGPQHVNVNGSENGVQITMNLEGVERPRPFGVSMWWTPGKSTGTDQTLFDWRCNSRNSNPDSIDRVHLQFKSGKLVFEVDDAFRRDSADDKYSSRIEYDFTDGLALEGDTWYHVTAFCRGDGGGQMCLWVDGKPRGKWSHMTRTFTSFDGSQKVIPNISIDGKRLADGTKRFPSKGAVRIGNQVVEYTGISGSQLTTARDVADMFGGIRPAPPPDQGKIGGINAKKGGGGNPGAPKSTTQHPAQSCVELYGYSARLASDIPAGSATLDTDGLGKFACAMIDPKSAKAQISIRGNKGGPPINLGMGIENTAQELDLLQLDGNELQSNLKTFQKNGGYALVVSYDQSGMRVKDPTDPTNSAPLSDRTGQGSIVGGVEVVWYASYSGSKLTGVVRGQSLVNELAQTDFGKQNKAKTPPFVGENDFLDKHAWLLVPNTGVFPQYKPKFVTALVIPIGVRASGANLNKSFLVPDASKKGTALPELFQIDSGFDGTKKNETEWVRYNALVQDKNQGWNFLRSDPEQVDWTRFWLQGNALLSGDTSSFNGNQGTDQYYAIASAGAGGSGWDPNGQNYKDLIDGLDYERLDPNTVVAQDRLAFRAVLGTPNGEHAGSAKLLPVFRVRRLTGSLRYDALPGRYDEVTVVLPDLKTAPSRYIVNYAWCGTFCEGWPNDAYSHVAFLDQEVATRVSYTQGLGFNLTDPTQFAAAMAHDADSRNFARLLKHPSGELPSSWDGSGTLAIAGDANGTSKSGGATTSGGGGDEGGKVDEVRVFGCADPDSIYPQASYTVQTGLESTEEHNLLLFGDAIRVANGVFGPVSNGQGLHSDACVLQLGDDFIECTDRQAGLPMTQHIADNGRRRYVDTPGYHSVGEGAQLLPWIVSTRLSNALNATDARVGLVDGKGFPRKGYVRIDDEILAFTDLTSGDQGVTLYCPSTMHAPASGSTQRQRGDAVFRGRFGTSAQPHAADAVVTWWPNRYDDGYAPRCDIPEMASLELPVAARRGLFHSVIWRTQPGDAGPDLVLTARVMGRGDFAADTDTDPDLFFFEQPGTPDKPNLIDRQGDLLLLRFNVRYRAGVLNLTDFTGNGWKRAPLLQTVGVDFVSDRVTELHEESR